MRPVIGLILSLSALGCSGSKPSPRVIYHDPLDSLDAILTRNGVTLDTAIAYGPNGGAIRIDSHGATTVRLAEVQPEGAEGVVLIYRGHLRTASLTGRAYLEMWCSIPGKGEFFSRALTAPLTGTRDWVTQETRFLLENGQRARTVKLNVVVDGTGVVWVDNIILVQSAR